MKVKTLPKHKRLSNRSTTPQQDMVDELHNIDKHFVNNQNEYYFTYKIKSTDTTNHYMVQTQSEKDQLVALMLKVYGFLTEYEPNIKQTWREAYAFDMPWFGEPTARLRRDPMGGYSARNQQSPYNVIGGQISKLARVVEKNEDISREMITRFNQLMRMIMVEPNGQPRWQIKAERI